jgi:2-polyprenyl-3-methyl-5-hydroxy-6-metoxy-1,4-benzoquinol methylase
MYNPESPRNRQYFQKQVTQVPDNLEVLQVLDASLPSKGRLLEIGSYLGIFLDRIRADGWQAVGLEPARDAANYARAKYHHEIIDGVLPAASVPDGHFDAVVMLHVIEHMPDPMANVREIRRMLKPGGVLAVETPRFNSLMFKILGHRERSIQNCQGHIFFFTEKTLTQTIEKNRFKVFRIDRVGRTLTLDRFVYNVGLITKIAGFQNWLARMSARFHWDRVRIHVNARDMQRIYARAV